MIIFHFTMPSMKICEEQALYFHQVPDDVKTLRYCEENRSLYIKRNSKVSFDTYFNCFSYSRYKKYTCVRSIDIVVAASGTFRLRIMACRTCDKVEEVVAEQVVDFTTSQKARLSCSFEEEKGDGFFYLEITALSDDCVFYGAQYETEVSSLRTVRLALIICTYHKEAFVRANMHVLHQYLDNNEDESVKENIWAYIIDNGNTLNPNEIEFSNSKLFTNINLGGSGGFTRGLIEVIRSKRKFTHFCMMDDDIRFDPEVLFKTVTFLRLLNEEHEHLSIGGAMLVLGKPYLQYEMGGIWNGKQIISLRHGIDVSKKLAVLSNEIEVSSDYNAWWYMCMPLNLAKEDSLPMPFFIKGDDIEYCMRNCKEILLMNGIAVWHEEFDKKYSGALEYYIKRNELILNALHRPEYGAIKSMIKLLYSCGKQIVLQRYFVVEFMFRAYEDFLLGIDFFLNTDAEALNKELMEQNVPMLDTKELQKRLSEEFPGVEFSKKPDKRPCRAVRMLTFYSYLIPRFFYPANGRHRILELSQCDPADFFGAECVVQFNSHINKGFITKMRKREVWRFGWRFLKLSVHMLCRYRSISKSYRARQHEVTSYDFWTEKLCIK